MLTEQRHNALKSELTELRREFHRLPEAGWCEYRTTWRIVQELERLGIPVRYGREIYPDEERLGVPAYTAEAAERAGREGCPEPFLEKMADGYTGCEAVLKGALPGKTTVLRFDIDCNELQECMLEEHRPCREGFASEHSGNMHACGHDGHIAIGIGTARLLAENREKLHGTVKFVFQPAEEGARGGYSFRESDFLNGADYLLGGHIGLKLAPAGTVAAGTHGILASTKLDVTFHGRSAHAANAPELGANALAAAAEAVSEILRIPEKAPGQVIVNVGTFESLSDRNVIPDRAFLKMETRGQTEELNTFAEKAVYDICAKCASRYGCTVDMHIAGLDISGVSDPQLVTRIRSVLKDLPGIKQVLDDFDFHAGEDVSFLMQCVQKQGGLASEMVFGTEIAAPHHNERFDFDESVLPLAAESFALLAEELGKAETV